MHFAQFRGRDVAEALAQVKAAFGANALIGTTRVVSNGRGGALGRSFVEVTAAQGADLPRRAHSSRAPRPTDRPLASPPGALANDPPAAREATLALAESAIGSELRALRALVEQMAQTSRPRDRALAMLMASGLDGPLAAELAAGSSRAARQGADTLRQWLRGRVLSRVALLPSPIAKPGPRIIACVGAAGVGKTTTLAKLAARAHLDLGRSVTLLTLDTFRVGAVEHTRRYAQLMGLNFDVAHDVAAFTRALACTSDELILVDTPSRASNEALERLVSCLRAAGNREVCVLLTVAASSRSRDVDRIASDYSACAPAGLVITKLDETDQVGGALSFALRDSLPFAYLCQGPRVPEDIQEASAETIADLAFSLGA
jgi:flagellar biosynthesis protein FlhF